ncbi:MAG TPA: hypothetical protein VMM54_13870 [Nitrospirota bacterium]|nr:hypothetical protein [Nitrospirota bacterium]
MSCNTKNQNIIRFVQNTLGCQCADEVFDSIELERGNTPSGGTEYVKMVIGNRLLIYIVNPISENLINKIMPMLTKMGRLERDNKGYNRFRLVLAKQSDDMISRTVIKEFKKNVGHDERAHIHIVSLQDLNPVLF